MNNNCPILCFNIDCKGKDFKKCDYFKTELSDYCLKLEKQKISKYCEYKECCLFPKKRIELGC